jgi:hypothetical protein
MEAAELATAVKALRVLDLVLVLEAENEEGGGLCAREKSLSDTSTPEAFPLP